MAADNIDAHTPLPHSLNNLAPEAALQQVQAVPKEHDVEAVLTPFLRQSEVHAGATGVRYLGAHSDRDFGVTRKHHVRYNPQWPGADLGSLVLFFDQPAPEHALSTAEDLISLMAGALNNALALAEARAANPDSSFESVQTGTRKMTQALTEVPRRDSLVLVALDEFESIRASSGAEWALWLLDSTQQVLGDALREADGVFQIREGLLAVLLPRTHGEAAQAVAKKIGVLIGTMHLSSIDGIDQLTACMGIATSKQGDDAKAVLTRAEQHLQLAQLRGPNAISSVAG